MVLTSSTSSPSAELMAKAEQIHRVLSSPEIDVWQLRELALTKGGLVDDAIRKKAWPILVGIDDANLNLAASKTKRSRATGHQRPPPPPHPPSPASVPSCKPSAPGSSEEDEYSVISTATSTVASLKSISSQVTAVTSHTSPVPNKCMDEAQVARDVARCTWHLLTGGQRSQRLQMEFKRNKKVARHIQRKQDRLGSLICDTLVASYNTTQPLCYYQGYHDVACIILSTLQDKTLASRVLMQISFSHLRDSCNADFESLQTALHLSVLPMLQVLDPVLFQKLHLVDMTPYFCLSWVITWFSHDVRDTALVKRLFDAFLASHAMFPVYMAVAMLICNRNEILECENDFSLLHQSLCGLPKNSSSVGWKYRPGEGYVTDEEQGGTTVSTTSSIGTADFLLIAAAEEAEYHESSRAVAVPPSTLLSSISSIAEPSVTFDELIQEAINIMKQIPPSHILQLRLNATRSSWFTSVTPSTPQPPLPSPQQLPRMLQEPPYWAVRKYASRSVAASAASAARKRRQGKRLLRSTSQSAPDETAISDEERLEVQEYLRNHGENLAVIAAGYGPGPIRSRARALGTGTVVVAFAVVIVAVGWAISQQKHEQVHDQETPETITILAVSSRVFEQSEWKNETVSDVPGMMLSEAGIDLSPCPAVDLSSVESSAADIMTIDLPTPQASPLVENPSAVPLSTELVPHGTFFAGASHYKVVFVAVERVIRQEVLQLKALVLIAYSVAKPLLFKAIYVLNNDFQEEFHLRWTQFLNSSWGKQFLRGFKQASLFLDGCKVAAEPHVRLLSLRAAESFEQLEGEASKSIRVIAAQIGNSPPGKQMRHSLRLVATSPFAKKIFEASVSALVEASFTSLYF